MKMISVSVVVPVRNEEGHIAACLQSLMEQSYPAECYEVIVVDGRSSDRSREIAEKFAREFGNVQWVDNPAGTVPVGMNIGIRRASGQIIVRADGHTIYPRNYLENCVKYLDETGADNVGGPCRTIPDNSSMSAHLVAAILSNPFGVGASRFRTGNEQGVVDTVPFGAFRREVFERVGMFNEKLVRNQDNELNARIRAAGGKIYQTPALTTEYHPVAGFRRLLSQTFKNSQWHIYSVTENARCMSLRHFVPAMFVVALVTVLFGAPFYGPLSLVLTLMLGAYLAAGTYFSFRRSRQYRLQIACVLPFACLGFHIVYGAGTLMGLRYLFRAPASHPIREGQPVR